MRVFSLTLLVITLFCGKAFAQDAPAPDPAPQAVAADEAPVPVPEPTELALQRHQSGNILWVINQIWGALIPLLFLFTGLSARVRDWATRLGRKWFFIVAIYFVIYALLNYLIDWPLAFYQGYLREHAYGLSNQTFQKWLQDGLLGLGVSIVMGVLFLWIPFLLLKKSPKRWWLYLALLIPPFLFFQMLVTPVFIDPLFNKFGPMENKELEGEILALAERSGIEGSRVYEVDKSVDTKAVNAYVTGFMNTKRIVMWDTLLEKLNEEEVLYVVGHEMGHYVLNHVIRFIVFISVILALALYIIHRSAQYLIRRYEHRFRFSSLSDIAALPLLLLMLHVLSFVATPLILGMSRYHEHEADRFGIELTHSNHAAATAFVKLQVENLAVPYHSWLFTLFRDSHPPIGDRIDFLNTYKPWETGDPVVYQEHFND